jgi:mono/diheme cytochrome c family protein
MVKMFFKTAVLGLALLAAGTMSFAQSGGEATYKAKCQMCHGATGAADTPAAKTLGVKPLNNMLVKMSDATLLNTIKNGSGKMPAYKDKLTDSQLQELVAYVDQLQKKK